MDSDKVRLIHERETYLITFYGKVLDSRVEASILHDRFADAAARRIDFDFESLKIPEGASITVPMRAWHLDGWTREFLAANPIATVLHLGCGLDSRVFRIDPPATVRWYDVDRPEIIDLRRQVYPEREHYAMIATSVTDLPWLEEIPIDRPVLVVAEGLVQYLPVSDRNALFNRITERFPSGQFIFDAYGRWTIRVLGLASRFSSTPVSLYGGIDDPRDLVKAVPRLELVSAVPFLTMPELVARLVKTRVQRATFRLMERSQFVKRSMQHLRYRF